MWLEYCYALIKLLMLLTYKKKTTYELNYKIDLLSILYIVYLYIIIFIISILSCHLFCCTVELL